MNYRHLCFDPLLQGGVVERPVQIARPVERRNLCGRRVKPICDLANLHANDVIGYYDQIELARSSMVRAGGS